MDAAATTLGLTIKEFRTRWEKLYGPEAAWLGETVNFYINPVCGGTRASFRLKTGQDAFNARPNTLRKFRVGLELQMVWIWAYVQSLNTAPVIALMTSLLGDLGYVYKNATPTRTNVYNTVWGICDFLAAQLEG